MSVSDPFEGIRGRPVRVMARVYEPHEVRRWHALTRTVRVEDAEKPHLYVVVLAVIAGRARVCGMRCTELGEPIRFTEL